MTTNPLLVTHTVPLAVAEVAAALTRLEALPGVEAVLSDEADYGLTVTYDVGQVRLDQIEVALAGATRPPGGLFNALRRRWVRFTEDNLLANAGGAAHTWYETPVENPRPGRPPERRHLDRPALSR